jgi:AraC-like DNA-binding protein
MSAEADRDLFPQAGSCYKTTTRTLVIYLEHTPVPPLNRCIRALWYSRAPRVEHRRERMLPSGCTQVILNLARDFLLDCPEGQSPRPSPPALIVGARSVYEIVDTSDMADLIGIVFRPGGFTPFAFDAADLFSNRFVSLGDVWGASAVALRERLRELPTPQARLRCLESFLLQSFAASVDRHRHPRQAIVDFALNEFDRAPLAASVRRLAQSAGLSERRFSQIFREQVGFSPKVWTRIQRFQRAIRQLHAGAGMRWTDLALDCGFYDQSHFANEFRAFSGIDATTYSARHTEWANHVAAD